MPASQAKDHWAAQVPTAAPANGVARRAAAKRTAGAGRAEQAVPAAAKPRAAEVRERVANARLRAEAWRWVGAPARQVRQVEVRRRLGMEARAQAAL